MNMTQDEIIKLAREADLVTWLNTSKKFNSGCWWIEAHEPDDCLFKFAELVAQREREACALICEELKYDGYEMVKDNPVLARKIRARGQA
jgi:hypothetical protein